MMDNFRLIYLLILMLQYQQKASFMLLFMGLQKDFKYNPAIYQFNLTNAKDHDWTTQYLLCKDYIFHQMTDKTNYVKQPKTELK